MKRTQLYVDEDIWKALHIRSRQSGTSISELVRQAVQTLRYAGDLPAFAKDVAFHFVQKP